MSNLTTTPGVQGTVATPADSTMWLTNPQPATQWSTGGESTPWFAPDLSMLSQRMGNQNNAWYAMTFTINPHAKDGEEPVKSCTTNWGAGGQTLGGTSIVGTSNGIQEGYELDTKTMKWGSVADPRDARKRIGDQLGLLSMLDPSLRYLVDDFNQNPFEPTFLTRDRPEKWRATQTAGQGTVYERPLEVDFAKTDLASVLGAFLTACQRGGALNALGNSQLGDLAGNFARSLAPSPTSAMMPANEPWQSTAPPTSMPISTAA